MRESTVAREHDAHRARRLRTHAGEQLGAQDSRHLLIRDDDVDGEVLEVLERLVGALGDVDFERRVVQRAPKRREDRRLVVDQEDAGRSHDDPFTALEGVAAFNIVLSRRRGGSW